MEKAWEWDYTSLVPRPSTPPVFDRLQYAYCKRSKAGGVEGLGTRLDYTLCALCILNLPFQVLIDWITTIIVLLYRVLSPHIVHPHTQFMDFVKKLASGELKVDDSNVGGKQTSSSA